MTGYKFSRNLSEEEAEGFREWARENYAVGDHIPSTWHPVIVDECMAMLSGKDKSNGVDSEEQS